MATVILNVVTTLAAFSVGQSMSQSNASLAVDLASGSHLFLNYLTRLGLMVESDERPHNPLHRNGRAGVDDLACISRSCVPRVLGSSDGLTAAKVLQDGELSIGRWEQRYQEVFVIQIAQAKEAKTGFADGVN